MVLNDESNIGFDFIYILFVYYYAIHYFCITKFNKRIYDGK